MVNLFIDEKQKEKSQLERLGSSSSGRSSGRREGSTIRITSI